MEENNQNSGEILEASKDCPSCAAEQQELKQAAEAEREPEVQPSQTTQDGESKEVKRVHKHNGRNKRGASKAQASAALAECGEIQDAASFKEKLSGSHLKGYEGSEGSQEQGSEGESRPFNRERRERRGRGDRRQRFENEAQGDSEREGPAFEKPSFKSRAVEVALDSKDFPGKQETSPKCDFVSSTTVEEPKVGVIARIKRMFASIFSKSEADGAKFKKNRKDWKGSRGDKNRRFSNSKNPNFKGGKNFRRGGKRYDKNFKQPRRENSGGNRQTDKA